MILSFLALLLATYPPGYLLGKLCHPLDEEDLWARVTVRLLLGLAFWPVAIALTTAIGLRLEAALVKVVVAAFAAAALVARLTSVRRKGSITLPGIESSIMALVMVATLALRLWQARGIVWPLWGDAVNHTAATMLVIEQGGIPANWQPYIPTSQTFSYHFGFHVWAALSTWIASVDPWWAVFWTERYLSILAPLGVYVMALALYRDRKVGIGAALAVGLLSKMPQYYINWSRDTQLAGQTLLPLLVYLPLAVSRQRSGVWRALALTALAVAALIFAHYRVFVFALALFPALALLILNRDSGSRWILAHIAAAAGAGSLLTAPWLLHVLRVQRALGALRSAWPSEGFASAYFSAPPLVDYVHPLLIILGLTGLALGLCRTRYRCPTLALVVWVAFLILAANGYRFRMRGPDLINYIAVFMVLYLPLAPLVGLVAAEVLALGRRFLSLPMAWTVILILATAIGFLLYGDIIENIYVLVAEPDVEAFHWIEDNTPPDAFFLVNSFAMSGEGSTVVGSDGGWWIPLATGRQASAPVINYANEVVSPEYIKRVNELVSFNTEALLTPEGKAGLCALGISHVYLGAVGGRLDGASIAASGQYSLLYENGGSRVFAVDCAR